MPLTFHDVGHSYGSQRVLSGVSLEARSGEILCLLGASGSGKTTLLRLAAGLERLQEGRITFDERVMAEPGRDLPPEKRSFGMVFQDHALFPHLTVAGNIAFGLAGKPKEEIRRIVAERLAAMGLAGYEDRYPHTLSGGQQQRVALARALAPSPHAMLLDEPFASVDVTMRRALREAARLALKAAGVTTLVVTHDPGEAMEIADRIAVMEGGHIAQCGTPSELYTKPATALVASLFGEAQRFSGVVKNGKAAISYGSVEVENLAEGASVDVVVRPEAVTLVPGGDTPLHVSDIRFMGQDWLVLLTHEGDESAEWLRARMPSAEGLEVGMAVSVRFDGCGTFVFPV